MSLTSILDYRNKVFSGFRTLLKEQFPTPKFTTESQIRVAPIGQNYSVIGMAFDYLLRFELERRYRKSTHAGNWAAEHGLSHFRRRSNSPSDGKKSKIDLIYEEFDRCKQVHREYINSANPKVDAIIDTCFFLSRLEAVYRTAGLTIHYVSLLPENKDDREELRQLMQCCSWGLFRPKTKIILNPHFGKASTLVGGADADLIIDDMLIDVKVVKDPKVTRLIYNQLIGYYLLYLIGGINGHKKVKLRKLGIFFARHNVLWTVDVDEVGNRKSFNKAKDVLVQRCKTSRYNC